MTSSAMFVGGKGVTSRCSKMS